MIEGVTSYAQPLSLFVHKSNLSLEIPTGGKSITNYKADYGPRLMKININEKLRSHNDVMYVNCV